MYPIHAQIRTPNQGSTNAPSVRPEKTNVRRMSRTGYVSFTELASPWLCRYLWSHEQPPSQRRCAQPSGAAGQLWPGNVNTSEHQRKGGFDGNDVEALLARKEQLIASPTRCGNRGAVPDPARERKSI